MARRRPDFRNCGAGPLCRHQRRPLQGKRRRHRRQPQADRDRIGGLDCGTIPGSRIAGNEVGDKCRDLRRHRGRTERGWPHESHLGERSLRIPLPAWRGARQKRMKDAADRIDIAPRIADRIRKQQFRGQKAGPYAEPFDRPGRIDRRPLGHQMRVADQWILQQTDLAPGLSVPAVG